MDDYNYDYYEFEKLIKDITDKLREANHMQEHMRWQFDYPDYYSEFLDELSRAQDGWISSHC